MKRATDNGFVVNLVIFLKCKCSRDKETTFRTKTHITTTIPHVPPKIVFHFSLWNEIKYNKDSVSVRRMHSCHPKRVGESKSTHKWIRFQYGDDDEVEDGIYTSAQIRVTRVHMALGRYSSSSHLLLSSICCCFICWLTACWLHSNWRPIVLTILANSPHDKIVIKFVFVQHVSSWEPNRGTGRRR